MLSFPQFMEESLKLEFESGVFLHSLLGGDVKELSYLEKQLSLSRVVTRDGWVMLEGPRESLDLAAKAFDDLEEARRGGALLTARDFRLAVDMVSSESSLTVSKMVQTKLLSSRTGRIHRGDADS